MTLLGPDRPGLVQALAQTVSEHGGNWLESRMAQLAGQFAGILRIECESAVAAQLGAALRDLERHGLHVHVVDAKAAAAAAAGQVLRIEVVSHDRPGIVRQLAAAIAAAGGNVEELTTGLESAPMAGHPLFRATGTVSLAAGVSEEALREAIENLGDDLSVDITAPAGG